MIVLDPRWLCGSVCGQILSQEFLDSTKPTGCYTLHDFQLATPEWNSDNLLPVLEAVGICTQVLYFTEVISNNIYTCNIFITTCYGFL